MAVPSPRAETDLREIAIRERLVLALAEIAEAEAPVVHRHGEAEQAALAEGGEGVFE